ncbi:unnamed protein product [Durusdinium trenchii]|uniref:Uncharacterized protein n=2 Tax=Durusdinium trenchii TaxID=1381693 RepID=A0ABP0NKZ4_9DINO
MPHEPRIRHPGADQDRPFPALLTKLHQLATPAVEDEWIEPEEASLCGTPYRRPQQKISHAELMARREFPAVAERILRELRGGDGRRFSSPAVSTMDALQQVLPLSPKAPGARRATVAAVLSLAPEEDGVVIPRRREQTWAGQEVEETRKLAELEDTEEEVPAVHRQPSGESIASSSACWKHPDSVIFIIDWDDTIFPTTWIQKKDWFGQWTRAVKLGELLCSEDLDISSEDQAFLDELDRVASSFLLAASYLGHVSCVTLAQRPWQTRTMQAFLPKLSTQWEKLQVSVSYAREEKAFHGNDVFSDPNPSEYEMLREMAYAKKKQKAMERVLRNFYKKGSWKNVISLGDGPAERRALQEIGFQHLNPASPRTGTIKSFRTKTVKMLEEPCCYELIAELQMISAWLSALSFLDEDFDVDLNEGEEALMKIHNMMMDVEAANASDCSSNSG